MTNSNQRIIGFVLHAELIVVSDGPDEFTRDWAFILLYNEKRATSTRTMGSSRPLGSSGTTRSASTSTSTSTERRPYL